METKISPNERHRFHFFNSFFFRKLADLDLDPESASEGRAAFLRVRKWTRKLNMFEKDYIFIPVNFKWELFFLLFYLVSFNCCDMNVLAWYFVLMTLLLQSTLEFACHMSSRRSVCFERQELLENVKSVLHSLNLGWVVFIFILSQMMTSRTLQKFRAYCIWIPSGGATLV